MVSTSITDLKNVECILKNINYTNQLIYECFGKGLEISFS